MSSASKLYLVDQGRLDAEMRFDNSVAKTPMGIEMI